MKIFAIDHESWVELKHNNSESYDSFEIQVVMDVVHSQFQAHNKDVHFLGLPTFVKKLKEMQAERASLARLEGTYQCHLQLEKKCERLFLSFAVGSTIAATMTNDSQDFVFESEFEIDEQSFNLIIQDFEAIDYY